MIGLAILVVVLVLVLVWLVASLGYVRSDEIGLLRYWGSIEKHVYRSGIIIVPLFPGIELVRIPKKLFRLSYEDGDEQLYTCDRQVAHPKVTFYVEFPFNDDQVDALIRMIEKDVPLTEETLRDWAEDILMPAMLRAISLYDHNELVGNVDLTDISMEVNSFLHRDGSILRECGVMGRDYQDTASGTGRAYAEVESVSLDEELQEAMKAPVVAKYQAAKAKQTAIMNAEQIGGQILGIVARKHGLTVQALEKDLRSNPKKAGQPTSEGGYKESFAYAEDQTKRDRAADSGELTDIRVGNTDGSAMNGELPAFAAAALLLRGGGRGGPGGKGGRDDRRKGRKGGGDEKVSRKDIGAMVDGVS